MSARKIAASLATGLIALAPSTPSAAAVAVADEGCAITIGPGDNQGSCTYLALNLGNGILRVNAPDGFAAAQVVCTVGASNLLLTTQTEGQTSFFRFGVCSLTLASPFAASASAT